MKTKKSYGFTLIELLIAVFISSIVLTGAFSIQMVFNNATVSETEVSDLQNSLAALKMFMRKTIRRAGAGLAPTIALRNCSGIYEYIPAVMVHNRNNYPAMPDHSNGGNDHDPDWIEFVAPDSVKVTSVESWFRLKNWGRVYSTTDFHTRDVVSINIGSVSCLMRINRVYNSSSAKYLGWYYRGGMYCLNPSNNKHPGCGLINKIYHPTQTVTISGLGEFPFQALRIDNSNPKRPILMHGLRKMEYGSSNYTWTPIAEGIEDMQIAFHVDTSATPDNRGDFWATHRDVLSTEYGRVRSIRVSIVARSPLPVSKIRARRPALEDRKQGPLDRYKRRYISFVVKIPNFPITGGAI